MQNYNLLPCHFGDFILRRNGNKKGSKNHSSVRLYLAVVIEMFSSFLSFHSFYPSYIFCPSHSSYPSSPCCSADMLQSVKNTSLNHINKGLHWQISAILLICTLHDEFYISLLAYYSVTYSLLISISLRK